MLHLIADEATRSRWPAVRGGGRTHAAEYTPLSDRTGRFSVVYSLTICPSPRTCGG